MRKILHFSLFAIGHGCANSVTAPPTSPVLAPPLAKLASCIELLSQSGVFLTEWHSSPKPKGQKTEQGNVQLFVFFVDPTVVCLLDSYSFCSVKVPRTWQRTKRKHFAFLISQS